jgi:hypothetical protein
VTAAEIYFEHDSASFGNKRTGRTLAAYLVLYRKGGNSAGRASR